MTLPTNLIEELKVTIEKDKGREYTIEETEAVAESLERLAKILIDCYMEQQKIKDGPKSSESEIIVSKITLMMYPSERDLVVACVHPELAVHELDREKDLTPMLY